MRNLIYLAVLAASLAACTSTGANRGGRPNYVDTGTNCPDNAPWYWCTGYRERGR